MIRILLRRASNTAHGYPQVAINNKSISVQESRHTVALPSDFNNEPLHIWALLVEDLHVAGAQLRLNSCIAYPIGNISIHSLAHRSVTCPRMRN